MEKSDRGRLHFCASYPQEVLPPGTPPGSHSGDGRKLPCASGRRRRKVAILKDAQSILFLTSLPYRNTVLSEPNLLGFYWSLTDLGGDGNTQPLWQALTFRWERVMPASSPV